MQRNGNARHTSVEAQLQSIGAESTESHPIEFLESSFNSRKDVDFRERGILHQGANRMEIRIPPIDGNGNPPGDISFQRIDFLPRKFGQRVLVKTLMNKFEERYRRLPFHPYLRNKFKHEKDLIFGDLPVIHYEGFVTPAEGLTEMRVLRKHLKSRMERLLSCLLIVNTAVISELTPLSTPHEKIMCHEKLNDWLLNEIFSPSSGIPVIGMIQKPNLETHRKIPHLQAKLITYFSKADSYNNSLSTACNLALDWYRTINPELANHLMGLWQGAHTSIIQELVLRTISSPKRLAERAPQVIQGEDGGFNSDLEMKGIPKEVIPDKFLDSWGEGSEPITKDLIQRVKDSYYFIPSRGQYTQKFQDIPVYLVSKYSSGSGGLVSQSIRIIEGAMSIIPKLTLASRLNTLLLYGLRLQQMFMENILAAEDIYKKQQVLTDSLSRFLKWIDDEMFQPMESLPIFGNVQHINPPLDKSRFGEIQLKLIHYLSNSGDLKLIPNISIYLIFHWYRADDPDQFARLFLNKRFFLSFMAGLLGQNVEHFREFRVNKLGKRFRAH
ncbi:hypothetical protein VP01_1264g5 [Puccinia sorghi]|uniref:Uncharacterized protein n=1 Tax=Puccinia sorghi TaxID=27349 RepID=A0A0L6VP53_9BASI|nr:hypothetical protein VP01_1264g5 [Puccinia sorghi]